MSPNEVEQQPSVTASPASASGSGRGKGGVLLADVVFAESVRCGDCGYFQPGRMIALGHCTAGRSEPVAGLWAKDPRACPVFLAADLVDAVRTMAVRWQYLPDELAWALKQAAVDPDGWRRLIEADRRRRLWLGVERDDTARDGESAWDVDGDHGFIDGVASAAAVTLDGPGSDNIRQPHGVRAERRQHTGLLAVHPSPMTSLAQPA